MALSGGTILFGYVAGFAIAAIACFGSLHRLRLVEDTDTRRGLAALLVLSGTWSVAHVGYLLAPTVRLQYAFYIAGLIVGFSAVGAWLYFCSAYSGRTLHRHAIVRRVSAAIFLGIVAIKLTNPIHGMYFTVSETAVPFTHLLVQHEPVHWLVMGLAYALAFVGFFMLFELFFQVGGETKPLAALVVLTGLPVVFDVVGALHPAILQFTYSPLGVAIFAIGVLYVYLDRFSSVKLAGEHDDPVVVLDEDRTIRDYNTSARELFPALSGSIGEPVDAVLPELLERIDAIEDGTEPVFAIDHDESMRYYQLSVNPLTAGHAGLGEVIRFSDVTHRERYRRELERQNERLEQFAGMISHDLRSPLNVAAGRIDMAIEAAEGGGTDPDENLDAAASALERMDELIDDLLALARQGQPIDEAERVRLSAIAEQSWGMVDTLDAELRIRDDATFSADPDRLKQLFENLFRNAIEHGGEDVSVEVGTTDGSDGFYVADDGPGIPPDKRTDIFESGYTTRRGGTGFGLAIVEEIVTAHDWEIVATESDHGGARFDVTGIDLDAEAS